MQEGYRRAGLFVKELVDQGGKVIADMELSKMSVTNSDFKGAADRQLATSKDLQAMAAKGTAMIIPTFPSSRLPASRATIERIG